MKEFVEKLIDRLEEEKEIAYADFDKYANDYELDLDDEYDDFYHKGLGRAIKIIKDLASEHNNDFCEWRKENSNKYVCDAHAEIHDSRVLDWCVCPYCGKEIKVVN